MNFREMTEAEILAVHRQCGSAKATAEKLGCAPSYISKIKGGLRGGRPPKKQRDRICCYPGCKKPVKPGNWMLCEMHEKYQDAEDIWANPIKQ